MEPTWVRGNESLLQGGLGHKTKMDALPIHGKNPLNIFFYGTKGPVTLWLGIEHWGLWPNKVCSNDDLDFFTARSNLLMGKYTFL